ncbi:ligand-binding sensor domain-containing protein [Flavipsychrobacter stenotrophus]|nr:two-component regulator propeller domain-containing protein [Flavipsychrobacter stenotrophus]
MSSCKGQVKTSVQLQNGGKPKLERTQGTGKYAPVGCGLEDKAGNLWFGTNGEGVYRYNPSSETFINFTEKDGLTSSKVWGLAEDKNGNIWLCTEGGVCRYDGKVFTGINVAATDGLSFIPGSGHGAGTAVTTVWRIFKDGKGDLWFGTSGDGVYRYNGSSFTHFLHNDGVVNNAGIRLNAVTSMLQDRAGNMWFSTWFEGLCRYDGKSITSFKPNGEVWFASLLEDKHGNIWAGRRSHGVCRYDPSAPVVKGGEMFTNVLQKGIFDSCCVNGIAEDKVGNIWFATEAEDMTKRESTGGVWRYDPSVEAGSVSAAFKNYTTDDGLTNNAVFSVTVDRWGKLWFGTRGMGLCSYDPSATKRFVDYTE